MKRAPKFPSLLAAQSTAAKFVREYISNTSLNLAELDEAQFKASMDAIVKAMMAAWADGFAAAREVQR